MRQARLGVLGGMGPMATSIFFNKIIESTDAKQDQDHIDMVILNHASLPDRTTAILSGEEEAFLHLIERDIRLLEHADVSNIAIPCNTSHYFYDRLQAMTTIPIINMVEETVREAYHKFGAGGKIGVFATKGTLRSEIYTTSLLTHNMEPYIPEPHQQDRLMTIIYDYVKGNAIIDANDLEAMINEFIHQHHCKGIILACTELSCIPISDEAKPYCLDAMDVLVHRSITRSGRKLKSSNIYSVL